MELLSDLGTGDQLTIYNIIGPAVIVGMVFITVLFCRVPKPSEGNRCDRDATGRNPKAF